MGNFIEEIIEKDLAENRVTGIITRFPPEPNGYLHIGHAKSICLNVGLAKKYGGKCNLRFDDTNPTKEEEEYVSSIIEDAKWLGWSGDIYFASDYFPVMYESAKKLILKGLAYVDDISAEDMRASRGTLVSGGEDSKNRNRDAAESLTLFEKMKDGLVAEGEMVLRAKIDMKSPNMNMRDPIIYRVVKAYHHRQKDKWNIYPMYDFAHPIEDAVEGITHSVCTLEFEDHRPLYDWVTKNCDFENPPHQYEFARLNIKRTIMSKRYLKKLVDENKVSGWDDPRMPTIAGLRRRGYTPSSIQEFCERIGVAKANSEVECYQLESCIRDELNQTSARGMAVLDPLEVEIVNRDEFFTEDMQLEINQNAGDQTRNISMSNKIYIERGDFAVNPPPKFFRLFAGGKVRLKGGYVISHVSHELNEDGSVKKIYAELVENTKSGQENSGIKVKGVVHWVDKKTCVSAEFRLYDYLLTDDDSISDFSQKLNADSLVVKHGVVEPFLASCEKGESFQFLRTGYFVRDIKENGLVFNRIVSLKDSFKPKQN